MKEFTSFIQDKGMLWRTAKVFTSLILFSFLVKWSANWPIEVSCVVVFVAAFCIGLFRNIKMQHDMKRMDYIELEDKYLDMQEQAGELKKYFTGVVGELKESVEVLTASLSESTAKLEAYHNAEQEVRKEFNMLKESYTAVSEQKEALEKRNSSLSTSVSMLQETKDSLVQDKSELKQMLNESEQFEDSNIMLKAKIEALEDELKREKASKAGIASSYSKLKRKFEQLESETPQE